MQSSSTTLRMDAGDKVFVWIVCGVLGLALGLALPWVLRHVATWPIPFMEYLKFLGSFDSPGMTIGRPLVLTLVGLAIAFFITHESPILTISNDEIIVQEGDDTRRIARDSVAGIYRRGGKIRIESASGRMLFEGDVEGKKKDVTAAFVHHGYPWEGAEAPTRHSDAPQS